MCSVRYTSSQNLHYWLKLDSRCVYVCVCVCVYMCKIREAEVAAQGKGGTVCSYSVSAGRGPQSWPNPALPSPIWTRSSEHRGWVWDSKGNLCARQKRDWNGGRKKKKKQWVGITAGVRLHLEGESGREMMGWISLGVCARQLGPRLSVWAVAAPRFHHLEWERCPSRFKACCTRLSLCLLAGHGTWGQERDWVHLACMRTVLTH